MLSGGCNLFAYRGRYFSVGFSLHGIINSIRQVIAEVTIEQYILKASEGWNLDDLGNMVYSDVAYLFLTRQKGTKS
jgi:hypothetical protein